MSRKVYGFGMSKLGGASARGHKGDRFGIVNP